jgi:competence protein ComEA
VRPDEATRARLALLARRDPAPDPALDAPAPPRAVAEPRPGGWVPGPPTPDDRSPVPDEADPADPLSVRDRALASAVAAYTAAYGHPLEAESMAPTGHRWATPGRVTASAVVLLVALGGLVVARAAQHSPGAVVALEEEAPSVPEAAGIGETVVVHVVGQVGRPGLVTLPVGARVAEAIEAAGGAGVEADLSSVNLARIVTDGEQILVPRPGEVPPEAASAPGSDPVDLNAASPATLETLPRIGPVLAQRIVDWRTDHGRFTSVDELAEVSGIGPALLDGVRDLVTVG